MRLLLVVDLLGFSGTGYDTDAIKVVESSKWTSFLGGRLDGGGG